ncbi:MAG TPA: glycosyltransferase family 4 protein [Terriglobales bacterium]|nr:glycosyltransferase family 4 protein [Terriglobales bacterium]
MKGAFPNRVVGLPAAVPERKVLLVSNRVMHYRVPVYNYFHRRFRESGFEFSVMADSLQPQNQTPLEFELSEMPFDFLRYRKAIADAQPAAVVLFLLLKDWITWPLMHWLKMRRIPFAFWTKGSNRDAQASRLRYQVFNYANGISDALILYSDTCRQFINPRFWPKAFAANNTINFQDLPAVPESKEEIKKEFGIPFEKVVIFVGRMGAEKGRKRVDHLVDIFKRLDRNDIGLVLVGSGLSDDLKARINPRNTRYLGEVHDAQNLRLSKLCKMADVCAIPGHVGLGLNQAFYWGLPVVTEECNHPPEIGYLKPGRNGFIVPGGDVGALQDRILYLLDNDAIRAEFSRHAREDILNEASIEGMFSGFKHCVEYLTSRQKVADHPLAGRSLQERPS